MSFCVLFTQWLVNDIYVFAVSLEQLLPAKDYVDMLLRRVKERKWYQRAHFNCVKHWEKYTDRRHWLFASKFSPVIAYILNSVIEVISCFHPQDTVFVCFIFSFTLLLERVYQF